MTTTPNPLSRVRRRWLLTGGALAAGGTAIGVGTAFGGRTDAGTEPSTADLGAAVVPFHGPHQAGIVTEPQAHAVLLAFDLRPGTDRAALGRMMRLLTDDAARLTTGRAALADTEPELATHPARLTVTFGFGPDLFAAAGRDRDRPASVEPLPAFGIDRLQARWSGGDLLIQVCADDPLTIAHAQRMLVKDTRTFATTRWVQRGFRRAAGVGRTGATQRNIMGQLDGTVQPAAAYHDRAVWISDGPGWLHGGSTLVVRRIRAELETWDAVDRVGKEFAVGRRLDTGAPLTGAAEHDPVDLTATDSLGLPVISEFAHVRRAHTPDETLRILRRPYNYDDGVHPDGTPDAGLIFASFQADIARQFIPVQRALAEVDLLNEWTTPVGSAVFAIPPGCGPDGWIGETLLA
ncbi:dye decolorizing peroxidase [Allocatelliglobosispora scoriae]|uniref:Dye decolorizing peroxidase n=1 Tax=Allocatelliglobosispora scoriae TaxID=643052 RepID=A0A841C618_9ACTN|nr:Dyp-type peroxidase [Allocatelliglobosispora scoriae]MBB5874380.1 dye decolorizing peroxidase [Allocatelliglobosispora scoriae]